MKQQQTIHADATPAVDWQLEELVVSDTVVAPGRRWMLGVLIIGGLLSFGLGGALLDGDGPGGAPRQESPAPSSPGPTPLIPVAAPSQPPPTAIVAGTHLIVQAPLHRSATVVRAAILVGGVAIVTVEQPVVGPGTATFTVPLPALPFEMTADLVVEVAGPGGPPVVVRDERLTIPRQGGAGLLDLDLRHAEGGQHLFVDAFVPPGARSVDVVVTSEAGDVLGHVVAIPESTATWGGLLVGHARLRALVPVGLASGTGVALTLEWEEDGAHHRLQRLFVVPGSPAGAGSAAGRPGTHARKADTSAWLDAGKAP